MWVLARNKKKCEWNSWGFAGDPWHSMFDLHIMIVINWWWSMMTRHLFHRSELFETPWPREAGLGGADGGRERQRWDCRCKVWWRKIKNLFSFFLTWKVQSRPIVNRFLIVLDMDLILSFMPRGRQGSLSRWSTSWPGAAPSLWKCNNEHDGGPQQW